MTKTRAVGGLVALAVAAAVGTGVLTPMPAQAAVSKTATIARWVDGDTLTTTTGQRIRLVGIDAAEMSTKNGPLVRQRAQRLAPAGSKVTLTFPYGTSYTTYGRQVAYVSRSGTDVGYSLIRQSCGAVIARYDGPVAGVTHPKKATYRAGSPRLSVPRASGCVTMPSGSSTTGGTATPAPAPAPEPPPSVTVEPWVTEPAYGTGWVAVGPATVKGDAWSDEWGSTATVPVGSTVWSKQTWTRSWVSGTVTSRTFWTWSTPDVPVDSIRVSYGWPSQGSASLIGPDGNLWEGKVRLTSTGWVWETYMPTGAMVPSQARPAIYREIRTTLYETETITRLESRTA